MNIARTTFDTNGQLRGAHTHRMNAPNSLTHIDMNYARVEHDKNHQNTFRLHSHSHESLTRCVHFLWIKSMFEFEFVIRDYRQKTRTGLLIDTAIRRTRTNTVENMNTTGASQGNFVCPSQLEHYEATNMFLSNMSNSCSTTNSSALGYRPNAVLDPRTVLPQLEYTLGAKYEFILVTNPANPKTSDDAPNACQ